MSNADYSSFRAKNKSGPSDNAKKWIENGNLGGKGTDVHKASIFMGILILFNGGAGLLIF